ncbi:hypothetical protein V6N11_070226 [Hibiscus sabdariffa]|uniref:Uncharacterized protein n=1 Tax=Hibiscus sabdariffa TaxID=183260 RepID=A0ABR2QEE3_9ROSI
MRATGVTGSTASTCPQCLHVGQHGAATSAATKEYASSNEHQPRVARSGSLDVLPSRGSPTTVTVVAGDVQTSGNESCPASSSSGARVSADPPGQSSVPANGPVRNDEDDVIGAELSTQHCLESNDVVFVADQCVQVLPGSESPTWGVENSVDQSTNSMVNGLNDNTGGVPVVDATGSAINVDLAADDCSVQSPVNVHPMKLHG